MEKVLITQNGNFLRHNPETDKFYFQTPTGTFLREVTHSEAEELGPKLLYAEVQDLNQHPEVPNWQFLFSVPVSNDFSNYQANSSRNGGNYSFHQHAAIFTAIVNGMRKFRVLFHFSTSAEFEYDELTGEFQTGLDVRFILNSNNQFRLETQSESNFILEQISQEISIDDILKLECHYIPSWLDEDDAERTVPALSSWQEVILNSLK